MIFEDRFTVKAPIERVWGFLRDPEQVGRCIPGTERVDVVDDTHYHVVAGARVGILRVSFAVNVRLTEVEPPRRLVSVAEGMDARIKERVKITSALTLEPMTPAETAVSYHIDLVVLGKLASLGAPVMKAKARQMTGEFATSIRTRLETV